MRQRHAIFLGLTSAALMVSLSITTAPTSGQRTPRRAPIPDDAPPLPANETACNYQTPLDFMVRENFLPRWTQPPEEQARRREMQAKVVRFRTENYGYFEGFGQRGWNENTPTQNAERVEFMGRSVRLNERITPALACVEEVLRTECADEAYEPARLSGIRTRNTYHNGQASNHVYGIAIDVDPQLNTCCMCVAQWGDHPLCQNDVESIYDRMSMPSCWVHVFERFGFYWLGRDRLQDTMHFEFLGDPEHILKTDGPPPHMSVAAPEGEDVDAEGTEDGDEEASVMGATVGGPEVAAADMDAVAGMGATPDGPTVSETSTTATPIPADDDGGSSFGCSVSAAGA